MRWTCSEIRRPSPRPARFRTPAGLPVCRCIGRTGVRGEPRHTVTLPKFGAEVLTQLYAITGPSGTVLKNRSGGLLSLSYIRSSLREALEPYPRFEVGDAALIPAVGGHSGDRRDGDRSGTAVPQTRPAGDNRAALRPAIYVGTGYPRCTRTMGRWGQLRGKCTGKYGDWGYTVSQLTQ